jgi:glycosyltransferase involved in cell wall biosynthesis
VLSRLDHPAISRKVQSHYPAAERLLANGTSADVALVQRTALPPEIVPAVIERKERTGTPLILELDDDLLALDDHHVYGPHRDSVESLLGAADLVTVSTPALAESVAGRTSRVAVVRNALDERLWFEPLDGEQAAERSNGSLRLLYMGTRTHSRDLAMLKPVLELLREAGLDVRLEVIGGEPLGPGQDWYERFDVPAGHAVYPRFVRWLRGHAGRWDLALAPLVDDRFNRSKSDLKFLEYTALGLPVVVSDVEAYRDIDGEVEAIKVPEEADGWAAAIIGLAEHPERGQGAAAMALERVREERCLRAEADRYLSILYEVAEGAAA